MGADTSGWRGGTPAGREGFTAANALELEAALGRVRAIGHALLSLACGQGTDEAAASVLELLGADAIAAADAATVALGAV